MPIVLSTCVARPHDNPARKGSRTGIEKLPRQSIDVFAPGPNYGDGSGVTGDFIGDDKHHGGADKAVYAYAREELDFWGRRLGRTLPDGYFGENLTTEGICWARAIINQKLRVGSALLQVSVPRTPCRTFAVWLNERGWGKTFTERGDCGCYFRVLTAGTICPGDQIHFEPSPTHGITMGQAFAAKMGNKEAAAKVVSAACLPAHHHNKLVKLLG